MNLFLRRAALALLTALSLALLTVGCGAGQEQSDVPPPEDSAGHLTEGKLSFPCSLAEGRLEVSSLFQFSGFNPDCGGEQGTDIAALQIKNVSGEHLESAELTLMLNDSVSVDFRVTDLPAGMEAMIFSTENISMSSDDVGTDLNVKTRFLPESPLMQGNVEFAVENMTVTLTNRSDQELFNLDVHCHSMLDGVCFGGLTYHYPIQNVPVCESVSVEALDCYLGGACVVRIDAE